MIGSTVIWSQAKLTFKGIVVHIVKPGESMIEALKTFNAKPASKIVDKAQRGDRLIIKVESRYLIALKTNVYLSE